MHSLWSRKQDRGGVFSVTGSSSFYSKYGPNSGGNTVKHLIKSFKHHFLPFHLFFIITALRCCFCTLLYIWRVVYLVTWWFAFGCSEPVGITQRQTELIFLMYLLCSSWLCNHHYLLARDLSFRYDKLNFFCISYKGGRRVAVVSGSRQTDGAGWCEKLSWQEVMECNNMMLC